jgi:hypothetical protein
MNDECPWDDDDDFDFLQHAWDRIDDEENRIADPNVGSTAPEHPTQLSLPLYPMWPDLVHAFARLHLLARLTQTSAAGGEPELDGLHRCNAEDRELVLRLAVNAPTQTVLHEARLAHLWFQVLLDGWVAREEESYETVLEELRDEVFGAWQGDSTDYF